MTILQMHRPNAAADYVEWQLLTQGVLEMTRGDLAPEAAWTVLAEDADGGDAVEVPEGRRDAQVDDCMNQISYRASTLKDLYALQIKDGVIRKAGVQVGSDAELVYRFLLACSRSELSHSLSFAFTVLCQIALTRFFSRRATVWNIEATSAERKPMGSTTPNVVKFLAPRLGVRVKEYTTAQLKKQGDGGCDLVATIEFSDQASGHLTALGQCAASSSPDYWRNKIAEPKRFRHHFDWCVEPTIFMFIPVVYRSSDGSWENEVNCRDMLMFDRGRIMNSLRLDEYPLDPAYLKYFEDSIAAALKRARSPAAVARKRPAAKKAGKKARRTVKNQPATTRRRR